MTDSNTPNYDASSIVNIRGLDCIRMRTHMYVGGKDSIGLHYYIFIVLDFMIEEAMDGKCHNIWVTLRKDNEVIIRNDSIHPTLNVNRHPLEDRPILELHLEELGCGGFKWQSYRVTGGLHGVGLQVAIALSSEVVFETVQEGYLWRKTYALGWPTSELQQIRPITDDEYGVTFILKPDYTLFDPNPVSYEVLAARCREVAYQVRGLSFTLHDETCDPPKEGVFSPAEGLKTWINDLNAGRPTLHEPIHIAEDVVLEYRVGSPWTIKVEFACQFTDSTESHILSYVNTVATAGGFHVKGMKVGILNKFNTKLMYHHLTSEPDLFTWDEIASGLNAVIVIQIPDPQYMSQSKMELMNPEVYGPVATVIAKALDMASYEGLSQVFNYLLKRRTGNSDDSVD